MGEACKDDQTTGVTNIVQSHLWIDFPASSVSTQVCHLLLEDGGWRWFTLPLPTSQPLLHSAGWWRASAELVATFKEKPYITDMQDFYAKRHCTAGLGISLSRLVTSPPIAKSKSKSTAFKSKSESKPKPNEHLVDANPPG